MQHTTMLKLVCTGAALTLLAVLAYDWLPDMEFRLVPGDGLEYYIYSDEMHGGKSRTRWINYDDIHWQCQLAKGVEYPYCGFHIYMGTRFDPPGLDLTRYKRIKVNLSYNGDNGFLRFYLRNHEPGFSSSRSVETAQFNSYSVDADSLTSDMALTIRDFELASWWIDDHQVPAQHARANFGHVIAFGVDLPSPVTLGAHEFRLNEVVFEGYKITAAHWYLSILFFWTFLLGGGAAATLLLWWARSPSPSVVEPEPARGSSEPYQLADLETDPATGLLTRDGMDTHIRQDIMSGRGGWPVSLLLVALDQAQSVRQTQGESDYRTVIEGVGQLLRLQFRQSDRLARWDDETFMVLLPNTPLSEAFMLAEKLRSAVAEEQIPSLPSLTVTVSIGVGEVWSSDAFAQVHRLVDAALYRAKLQGQNRVVCQSN